jgi:hypothetical protein
LFLKAVPVSTGTNLRARVPLRMHFFSVSTSGAVPAVVKIIAVAVGVVRVYAGSSVRRYTVTVNTKLAAYCVL